MGAHCSGAAVDDIGHRLPAPKLTGAERCEPGCISENIDEATRGVRLHLAYREI
jgi:hypothetical protein